MPRGGKNAADLIGQRFGRLVVISSAGSSKHQKRTWSCQCDCGVKIITTTGDLRNGTTKSCSCIQKEWALIANKSHGMSNSPEYEVWIGMKKRCLNKSQASFKNYGGRGIRVCKRWIESFEGFIKDMGHRPSDDHTIERVDPNGDYEPGNTVWLPSKMQALNKRSSVRVEWGGKTQCLSEWSKELSIPYETLRSRIKSGLTPPELFASTKWRGVL